MRGFSFVLLVIILILIGGVAGYFIGTSRFPVVSTIPLTTITPIQQLVSPTVVPSPTIQPSVTLAPTLMPTKAVTTAPKY